MRNKFLQKKFGDCVLHCIANHIGSDAPINDLAAKFHGKGISNFQAMKILEDYTGGKQTLKTVFLDETGLTNPFVLDRGRLGIPKNFQEDYLAFFMSIKSKTKPDKWHYVYCFKQINSEYWNILDPYNEKSERVHKFHVIPLFVTEIQVITNNTDGGFMVFKEDWFY